MLAKTTPQSRTWPDPDMSMNPLRGHERPTRGAARGRLGFLALAIVVGLIELSDLQMSWAHYGARDWIAYWSVQRNLLWGGDYFDIATVTQLQLSLHYVPSEQEPILWLWNLPLILVLLLPMGGLDFAASAILWHLGSLLLYLVAARQFNQHLASPLPLAILFLVALLFVPSYLVIGYGQLGLFLAAALIFAWQAQRRGHNAAAGILLVPLLVKPHIVLLPLAVILLVALRRRAWATFLSFGVVLLMLAAIITLLSPTWFNAWRSQGVPAAWSSVSPWDIVQGFNDWPQWTQFLGLFLIGPVTLWRNRHVAEISPARLGALTLLSMVASPYNFTFDAVMLLPGALCIAGILWRSAFRLLLFVHTALNVLMMPWDFYLALYLSYLIIFVALWVWTQRLKSSAKVAT
jgi:hypothetical protein